MPKTFETHIKSKISDYGSIESYIEFPPEVIEQLSWKDGDILEWEVFPEFAVLTKKQD